MPCLEIPAAELDTRMALAYVEAVMAYPSPEEQESRERLIKAADLQYTRDAWRAHRYVSAMHGIPAKSIPIDEVVRYDEMRESVPDIKTIREEARQEGRYLYGLLAGLILNHILAAHEQGETGITYTGVVDALLNWDRAEGDAELGKLMKREKVNKTYLNAKWPKYRRVAHLYSARRSLDRAQVQGSIPCRTGALPFLLALAEHDRKLGEELTFKNGKPVLNREESWYVPANIELPSLSS